MLRAAQGVAEETGLRVRTTCLAAHALPEEWGHDRTGYVDFVVEELLPEVAREGLAYAVDAFLEDIAFTEEECERVLSRGRELGLAGRLHADQLSDGGGAELAARMGALSADHLERTSVRGAQAMGAAGTAAVLLPGAYYYLRETVAPPVAALRESHVPMAVATDANMLNH